MAVKTALMTQSQFSFFVQWHLTEKCNLKCRHCYQNAAPGEMSVEEVCQAVTSIKETIDGWGEKYAMETSPSLHFTGGEPVVYPGLFTVLEHARRRSFSTSLMSNGTLITPQVARRIKNAGVLDVQVSLDGLRQVHDSIRGNGSFDRAVQGLHNLVSEGIYTNINITLSRVNSAQLEGLVELAEEVGAGAVTFSRLVPCGRGLNLAGDVLTPAELARLYREARLLGEGRNVAVSSGDPLFAVADMEGEMPQSDFPIGGCAAGMSGVTITSDGSVMPCRRMDLVIGNIKEQSLRELWADSPAMWALRDRKQYHDGCESCRFWAVCRGCRAIALASARAKGKEDFLGPDPQCPYYAENSKR